MRKLVYILLGTMAAFVGIAVVLILYLRNADLSVYEDYVEAYLAEQIGHQLDIDGLFELHVRSQAELIAEQVTLVNTDWPSQPLIVSVDHISITVDLWSLVAGPVIVEDLDIRDVQMYLERDAGGMTNWGTATSAEQEPRQARPGLVVFRDVAVEGVKIIYADAGRPMPIDVSLERLRISPDEDDVLDLDLKGTMNGFPLSAEGKLGPWQNLLDGRDLIADLGVTLGELHLAVSGSVEDAQVLAGVEATLSLSGPEIGRITERLGLPPFAEGPFQIDGTVNKLDDANEIRVEGNLGAINVFASGSVDRLLNPGTSHLEFNLSGPDVKYVAEVFDFKGAPAVPFTVAGDLGQQGKRLSLAGTRAELGENSIAVDGWVDTGTQSTDMDLTINATGPNFSVFAPFIGMDAIPGQAFDVDGRVLKSGDDWRFEDFTALVGENRASVSGAIAAGADTELVFTATGPDNTFLQAMTGLQGLPARPFDISARMQHNQKGISLAEARAVFGEHRLEAEGIVSTASGFAGTQLDIQASGPELKDVALLTDIPYLPAGPYAVGGNLQINRRQLLLRDATATVGELTGTVTGSVGLGNSSGEFDLTVSAKGPEVAGLADFDWTRKIASDAVSVSGYVRRDGADFDLESVNIGIGAVQASLDGCLSLEPLTNDSDLNFRISGPDLDRLTSAFDLDVFFPAKPFSVSGQFDGTPSGFAMRDFTATIGDNDISGVFDVDLREKPKLTGTLSSSYLDLTERLQQVEEQDDAKAPIDESEFVFSKQPLDTSFLQAADIKIDLAIDRLQTRSLVVSDVRIGTNLVDGALRIDPVSVTDVDGNVSGWLSLVPSDGMHSLDASLVLENLHIGLTELRRQDRALLPAISGEVRLRGAGRSLHELMASSNGTVALRQGPGRIRNGIGGRIFGDIALTIIRTLNPLREKQEYSEFDCGIYDANIADGIVTIDNFVVQTTTITTLVVGDVKLGAEKIDLTIHAKPREGLGISLGGVANSFLKLGGTLKAPVLQVDAQGTLVTGGIAVATGGISLLAKGLLDRVSAAADICEPEVGKGE
jgi:uncharacterized protein involved in outer membrane biogenesis